MSFAPCRSIPQGEPIPFVTVELDEPCPISKVWVLAPDRSIALVKAAEMLLRKAGSRRPSKTRTCRSPSESRRPTRRSGSGQPHRGYSRRGRLSRINPKQCYELGVASFDVEPGFLSQLRKRSRFPAILKP
jgi:hypothetical protein